MVVVDDGVTPVGQLHAEAGRAAAVEGQSVGFDVPDFSRWSALDLCDNISRGVLTEFIVARELRLAVTCPR